jgi:iron complex outermembrane receptor protein
LQLTQTLPSPTQAIRNSLGALTLLLAGTAGAADPSALADARRLADLSIQELMDISVTSVSKKETKLNDSPAAISVITQEDIRRSGLTSLPELLRTVPGLDVARVSGNQWAISARGFNDQFANKLLVLVDGRTIYTPVFGGVFWNAQDLVLEDLDRIEVIRGPGATLWGANAVNGVINITTKSAKATQGTLVTTTVGTEDQPTTAIRYGGQLGTNLFYRAYVKYFDRDGQVISAGADAPDAWSATRGGLRLDWEPSTEHQLTLQGDYYSGTAGNQVNHPSLTSPTGFVPANLTAHNRGGNVLGRWTRTLSDTAQLTVQTYYDHFKQDEGFETVRQDTCDFELQHRFAPGERHDLVWGAGYRMTQVGTDGSFFATLTPSGRDLQLFNFFLQDEITLVADRVKLTLGSKFEHNDLNGLEIQPSARLLWTPTAHQSVWAAASRAIRTPSLVTQDSRINFAVVPGAPATLISAFGNPNIEGEEVFAYELGYRIEPVPKLSLDATAFYNVYDGVIEPVSSGAGLEATPAPPHALAANTYRNAFAGETYGAELAARWQVTDAWRLSGSYTWLQIRLRPTTAFAMESPQQQFQFRSDLNLTHNIELSSAVYYVDQVTPMLGAARVPVSAYVRLDLGVTWRPTKNLELSVHGQNLLDNQHPEFYSGKPAVRTEVARAVLGKVTWRF